MSFASGICLIIPANGESGQIILDFLYGRSGDSAERRHFESGQRRSADAPLRANFIRNFCALA
jgi:hypothetical protein